MHFFNHQLYFCACVNTGLYQETKINCKCHEHVYHVLSSRIHRFVVTEIIIEDRLGASIHL